MTERNLDKYEVWPGLSFELLPGRILDFIFNPMIVAKMLGFFAGEDSEFQEGKKEIVWDKAHGVAPKGASDEVIFLGASSTDIRSIISTMESLGIESLLNTIDKDIRDDSISPSQMSESPTAEILEAMTNKAVSEIGKKISIVTAKDYDDASIFIQDHTSPFPGMQPNKMLTSQNTKGMNKGKIVAQSHSSGSNHSSKSDSHPSRIPAKTANIANRKYEGMFQKAKLYRAMHKES